MTKAKTPAKKNGRPTKKSAAVVKKLLISLRNGSSRESASAKAGITKQTLYNWIDADPTFLTELEVAEFEWMETVHSEKKKLIKKGHRPAIEKELKSKERKVYGDKQIISGDKDAPLEVRGINITISK